MNPSTLFSLVSALFLTVSAAPATSAEVAVIAHPSTSANSLDEAQVKKLFLGKTRSLPDGSKAELVDQREGDPTRDEFYAKAIGKDAAQMKAYWSKLIFSGRGVPPAALDNDAEVKGWVAKTPGGIGYVDASMADDSVKVLYIIK